MITTRKLKISRTKWTAFHKWDKFALNFLSFLYVNFFVLGDINLTRQNANFKNLALIYSLVMVNRAWNGYESVGNIKEVSLIALNILRSHIMLITPEAKLHVSRKYYFGLHIRGSFACIFKWYRQYFYFITVGWLS